MTDSISPILRVADALVALSWYQRLGFEEVSVHRFGPGMPVYLIVRRGDAFIHLSEHLGDARPHGLAYLWVDDVDSVAAEFGVPVEDNPWARDVQVTDPDGNRIRVGTSTGTSTSAAPRD